MSVCVKIKGKRREICVADLDREILLLDRNITPPVFGEVDFLESFEEQPEYTWAMIETVSGKTFFDDVNSNETAITHNIYIQYEEGITAEFWILFEGRYFDVLDTDDFEERHDFIKLVCRERGKISKLAAHA